MYRSLNDEMRKKFGEKVYKLALEGGFSCPNRDGKLGTKGCIFCLGGSGDFAEKPCENIFLQIEKAKARVAAKNPSGQYIAYFQSYTNTYGPVEKMRALFYRSNKPPGCRGSFHRHKAGLPAGRSFGTAFGTQQNKAGMGGTGFADRARKNRGIYPQGVSSLCVRFRRKTA